MLLTDDVPSFVRLNETFPEIKKGASVAWLYSHIKNLVVASGISPENLANEQIDILADIIVGNYPSMKLTEFMLFESRFLSGMYEEFYGETSYILAITRSLQRFRKDLNLIYAQIEREKQERRLSDRSGVMNWKDYCRYKGVAESPSPLAVPAPTPLKVPAVPRTPSPLFEVQTGVSSAHAIIDNTLHLDQTVLGQFRDAYRKRYGCSPEDYLSLHEEKQETPVSVNTNN